MITNVRLLLVEDNAFDAESVIEHLAAFKLVRVNVDHVTSLQEAQEQLRSRKYDGIVLDLQLPDSCGIDTVSSIASCCNNVPILVLTGSLGEESGPRALAAGASMFMRKGQTDNHRLAVSIMSLLVTNQISRGRTLESAS